MKLVSIVIESLVNFGAYGLLVSGWEIQIQLTQLWPRILHMLCTTRQKW